MLEPLWPKGYFRKGRALFGLKVTYFLLIQLVNFKEIYLFFDIQMYKEAEESYEKVLEIESIDDPELEEELFKTRVLQLQVNP